MPLLWNKVETGKSGCSSVDVISTDVFLIRCRDVKWMIMLSSPWSEAVGG